MSLPGLQATGRPRVQAQSLTQVRHRACTTRRLCGVCARGAVVRSALVALVQGSAEFGDGSRVPALAIMLSATSLDDLLSVLSTADAPFSSLVGAVRGRFAASSASVAVTPFECACACAMLLDGGGDGDVTLRPQQRLAAIYLVAAYREDDVYATGGSSSSSSGPLSSPASHPFLEVLLQQLDRCEFAIAPRSDPARSVDRPSSALLERCFLLQLLLPQLSPRAQHLDRESPLSWSERAATYALHEPSSVQSAVDASPLATALAPLRQLVRANQPPALLMPTVPTVLLHTDLIVSASHLTSILGDSGIASIHPSLSAAVPPAHSSSSLSLRVAPSIPRLAPPPLVDLHWHALAPDFGPELAWMHWDPPDDLNWDVQPTAALAPTSPSTNPPLSPTSMSTPIAQLLVKALKSPLLAAERAQLVQQFKATVADDHASDDLHTSLFIPLQLIPPTRLAQLVEKNHEVAREFLLQLMAHHRAAAAIAAHTPTAVGLASDAAVTVNSYLSCLVQMDLSLHSMELVKDLALAPSATLPADFLHLYICKCMHACTHMADKFLQNRHVRLICVFLQALLRHKILPLHSSASLAEDAALVRDVMLVEVQAFLVEFSRIKEAANLYKQIKQLEANHTL